jgi:hypothetical protein
MIVYDLACDSAHRFEGWFSSAEDFDAQAQARRVSCPVCGSVTVSRQLSAPYLNTRSASANAGAATSQATAVTGDVIEALRRKFVEHVLAHTEDVGARFPEEARRIHYSETPQRSIRGRASADEVQELRDEGIEVLAVPGVPVPPGQVH